MIAFHLIVSAYGFWLPNDPRGSWSEFVYAWELRKFGPATKVNDPRSHAGDLHDVEMRRDAKEALKFPPVRFDDAQREAVAEGFAIACAEAGYGCRAGCIGFDHAHLVIESHARAIKTIAGHLKAQATRALTSRAIHPLAGFTGVRGGFPTPWSHGCWKVYIDLPEQLSAAVAYVERHPRKEGLADQRWKFARGGSKG